MQRILFALTLLFTLNIQAQNNAVAAGEKLTFGEKDLKLNGNCH